MARLPRLVVPGQLHHLLQRGNNRQAVFVDDEDRKHYLDHLREATRLHGVHVHAYVLMPNHVHLLATPSHSDSFARAMQTLGRRYVTQFNRRHQRSGTLWEGRFRTTLIETPRHFLDALVYVEQHPVRDGLVDWAGDHPWSSARHHLGLLRDSLIAEHRDYWALGNTPFERDAAVRQALSQPLPSKVLDTFGRHAHNGWPLVSEGWALEWTETQDRPIRPRPRGRPVTPRLPIDSVPI
jgi:putative transposase